MSHWRPLMASLALLGAACSLWPLPAFGPATATPPGPTATASSTATPSEPAVEPTPMATLPATPELGPRDLQAQALQEAFQSELQELESATRYHIDARVAFNPAAGQAEIEGLARIVYTNQTGQSLPDVVLRLWPNDVQYLSRMTIGAVLVDGTLHSPSLTAGGTAALIELQSPLEPAETIDLTVPFLVEVTGEITSARPKRFGITNGVLLAPTFYPLVPRFMDGSWETVVPPEGGDTTTSETAFYELSLRVPSEYQLVATGSEIERSANNDGTVTVRIISGPVRDVALSVGTFVQFTEELSGVTVHAWMLPEHEDEVDSVMEPALRQLDILTELVGPYPYPELDIVDAPGAFGGIEYPGLIYIGTVGSNWVTEPVVHEVAHQWFYGVIGNDQVSQPWLDEAAATYATALYYEYAINPGRGTAYLSDFRNFVREIDRADQPIGGAVGDYAPFGDYGALVYGKGALFLDALRAEMGDEEFFRFLMHIYREYDFDIMSADEFHANAEAICSCELDPLFDLWVYQGGEAIPR